MEDSSLQEKMTVFPNNDDSSKMKEADNQILCDHFLKVKTRHLLKRIMACLNIPITGLPWQSCG